MPKFILGIDTSNYTTSLALVDTDGKVISEERQLLDVNLGARGLRQSEAFFQHVKSIPDLLTRCLEGVSKKDIVAIAVANRPRNINESYMPVFVAGEKFAEILSSALDIPLYRFSHQEGHIKAIENFNPVGNDFICFHLSGGTSEILKVSYRKGKSLKTECIGKSLDISFGQLIDRVGVALGCEFPAGSIMDKIAMSEIQGNIAAKEISIKDMDVNLSGIETQMMLAIETFSKEEIAYELFIKIASCLQSLVKICDKKYPKLPIIFAGGVSQSEFIRNNINERVIFGRYGSDNAVGIALLGGETHGRKAD